MKFRILFHPCTQLPREAKSLSLFVSGLNLHHVPYCVCKHGWLLQLEDLKRSPDLLNIVKIGHGQLRLIIKKYFVLPYMGIVAILVKYHIYIY